MQSESIYNLIQKEYVQPPKEGLYKSKHSPYVPPTGSTFGHQTTSVPKVSNMSGGTDEFVGPHTRKAHGATFGQPKGALKPQSDNYAKKGTGTMGKVYSPPSETNFKYDEQKKPAIPKKDEKPIMGLKTQKNYVVANAVENMLAQPKVTEESVKYTQKQEYGKIPKYLENIKDQTNREYEHIKALHLTEEENKDREKFILNQEEVKILRDGLKRKWEAVNKEYQQITHISKIDTVGLKRKKEDCERELAQIEKDLEKLNKDFIFVDTTQ